MDWEIEAEIPKTFNERNTWGVGGQTDALRAVPFRLLDILASKRQAALF
jgi:hypothetical protein